MEPDTILAIMDGRLVEGVETGRRMQAQADEAGVPEFAQVMVSRGQRARLHLGDAAEALQRLSSFRSDVPRRAVCLAQLGREVEVREILERQVVSRPAFGTPTDETWESHDVLFLEAAVVVKHGQAVSMLVHRLAGCGRHTTANSFITCSGRHLGAGCALLGRYEEARAYYGQALEVAEKMRFRPEIALTRLQLTELLLDHYPQERSAALAHLDFAIGEFQEMKMEPALRQALSRKEILKA
jgi:tetratricopeptide (TPR) repeat protein